VERAGTGYSLFKRSEIALGLPVRQELVVREITARKLKGEWVISYNLDKHISIRGAEVSAVVTKQRNALLASLRVEIG